MTKKLNRLYKQFTIASVAREDILCSLCDCSIGDKYKSDAIRLVLSISDKDMQSIADKMSSSTFEGSGFWLALEYAIEMVLCPAFINKFKKIKAI